MRPAPAKHTISYQLREIIRSRGLTASALGRLAGVDPGGMSRFLAGKRGLTLETLDRIGAALGLRLVEDVNGRYEAGGGCGTRAL